MEGEKNSFNTNNCICTPLIKIFQQGDRVQHIGEGERERLMKQPGPSVVQKIHLGNDFQFRGVFITRDRHKRDEVRKTCI